MWNFLCGGLSLGCTLVLYDGSPLKDPGILWRLTDQLGITIFGTSAKYIEQLSVRTNLIFDIRYSVLAIRKISVGFLFPSSRDLSYLSIPRVLIVVACGLTS
jgi:acetoacetyl-CoA synthetase